MAVFDNLNLTTSAGVAPGMVDYYERKLIENAKPEMVHARDAQKRPLPENNGKHVNFRRMIPFEAVTTPLTEGVTPEGQTIRQTAFTAMVKPYGSHVEITDELDLYHIDNLHRETANLLSDQAALSLDTICRDAMCAGMNVQYAGTAASRSALTASDKLTAADIKKAVRTLKRNNCKPFADGFYHAIVHPDAVFDLTPMMRYINRYASYIDMNLRMASKGRLLEDRNAGIDKQALLDWENDVVEGDRIDASALQRMQTTPFTSMVTAQMLQLQNDIKQDSGQNQFTGEKRQAA